MILGPGGGGSSTVKAEAETHTLHELPHGPRNGRTAVVPDRLLVDMCFFFHHRMGIPPVPYFAWPTDLFAADGLFAWIWNLFPRKFFFVSSFQCPSFRLRV